MRKARHWFPGGGRGETGDECAQQGRRAHKGRAACGDNSYTGTRVVMATLGSLFLCRTRRQHTAGPSASRRPSRPAVPLKQPTQQHRVMRTRVSKTWTGALRRVRTNRAAFSKYIPFSIYAFILGANKIMLLFIFYELFLRKICFFFFVIART